MAPKVQALLVDLGGVVVSLDWERCFSRWASDSGERVEAIRARCRFDEPYRRHERGEIGESEYYASLRRSIGIDLTDEQFAAGWRAIFAGEIVETVRLLRAVPQSFPVYAFSNTNAEHHDVWSRRFEDALTVFRKVFVSHEMGKRKPEREAFEHIAREIGVPAGEILFFDDTLENVEGARKAGLQAVHVKAPRDVADALRRYGIIS